MYHCWTRVVLSSAAAMPAQAVLHRPQEQSLQE